jgi:peptidoglycan/LPS O-acetylase OafA/YrhL
MTFWPVPGQPQPTLTQWLSHAVIVSRLFGQPFLDGAYWTIVYELVFYIWVFVLLATRLFDKHWREVVLAWLVISIANEFFIGSGVLEKLFVTKYSGCFLFGWVLYHTHQARTRKPFGLLAAMGLWATLTPILNEPQITAFYGVQRDAAVLALLGALSAVALVVATSLPSIPLPPQKLMMVTAITYPVYLLHQNVGYAIFNRFGEDLGRWASLASVLVAVGGLSWFVAHYLEPFCRPRLQRVLQNLTASQARPSALKPA